LRRQDFLRLKARSVLDFARWGGAVHRSNEAITAAGERLNKDRSVCRFAQRIAQPLDRGIQAMIEVNEGVRRPEFIAQFLSSNELSRPFQERRQYLKGLFLQFYLLSPLAQFPGVEIDLEGAEADDSE
jgi:hypothetical protein